MASPQVKRLNSLFSGIDDAITLDYHNVAFPFAILISGLCAAFVQVAIEAATRAIKKESPRKVTLEGVKYEIQA